MMSQYSVTNDSPAQHSLTPYLHSALFSAHITSPHLLLPEVFLSLTQYANSVAIPAHSSVHCLANSDALRSRAKTPEHRTDWRRAMVR